MKLLSKLMVLILGILLSLNIFLLIFNHFAFNESYFVENFIELGVADTIGMSESDLKKVTHELVSYIDSGEGDLYVSADINNQRTIYFNQKERIHLDDIYKLAKSGRFVLLISQFVMIFAFLILYYISDGDVSAFLGVFLTAIGTAAVILISLGILYFTDFTQAFHKFHEIFFTNDYWLLDPSKDRLIQLMPLKFFIDFTKTWLLTSLFAHVMLFFSYWLGKKISNRLKPVESE